MGRATDTEIVLDGIYDYSFGDGVASYSRMGDLGECW